MKQLNKLRAELIYGEYKTGDCSIVVSDIMRRYLKDFPSIIEKHTCKSKGCGSKNTDQNFQIITLSEFEFGSALFRISNNGQFSN